MSERAPGIVPIRMPKWGLSMDEGLLVAWLKAAGDRFSEGEEIAEIETSKINNVFEAPTSGLLRRLVAAEGETVPVGGLLAVAADPDVDDADIDAFVADFQAAFVPGEAEDEGGPALERKAVGVGDRQINAALAGAEGPWVVLLHGFSGDVDSWALNIGDLARSARIAAIDLPGHGGSTKDVGDGSLDTLAEAVSGALDQLDVQAAHLVGHSLGGAVAAHLAQRAPERFRSLVLVAPAGLPGGSVNRDFLDGIVEGQRPRDLQPMLELLFHDPGLASSDMAEEMARYKRIDGVEECLAAIRDQLASGVVAVPRDLAPRGLPPTLVVLGDSDQIVGAPDGAALPASWRVVTLERCGHMPMVEQAGEFNRLLTDFISENS